MKPTRLGDMAAAVGGKLRPEEAFAVFVNGVSIDSRRLAPGDVFFALVAERDGHDFLDSAIESGAAAAVVSRDIESSIPLIRVSDTLKALERLAAKYRKSFDGDVIAITGSLGKTTTREAIAGVLKSEFEVARSRRNFNNLIGLPLSILNMESYHDIAILELGINLPGEMDILAKTAAPDFAVITNIAPVHLQGLRCLEKIAAEKLKLLDYIRGRGKAFLNADDEILSGKAAEIPSVTFGFDSSADFRITDFEQFPGGGIKAAVNGTEFSMPLSGSGAAYAAAAAWALGEEYGIEPGAIRKSLSQFEGFEGRMQLLEFGKIRVIADTYNSSPLAVQSALKTLDGMEADRRIAVLGDMLELGPEEMRYHREMGRSSAESDADILIYFGDLSRAAYDESVAARGSAEDIFWSEDYEELAVILDDMILPGDLILLKGSRGMTMERFLKVMEKRI